MIEKETLGALIQFLDDHPDHIDVKEITSHHFSDGVYIREMYLPAGTMLVGMEHKTEHFFHMPVGHLTIWDGDKEYDIEGPFMGIVPVGAQRVGYAHEDTICFATIPNPDNCTDIDELEARHFKPWGGTQNGFNVGAWTAAVVAVGSMAYSTYKAGKANKASRKGSKERRKADLMSQFLKRRQMLQEYRMAQATVSSQAVASGAGLESSGIQGVQSSITAQTYYNLNAEERIIAAESKAFDYDMMASRQSEQAALWSTIGSIAGTFAGGLGGAGSAAGLVGQAFGGKGATGGGGASYQRTTGYAAAPLAPAGPVPGITSAAAVEAAGQRAIPGIDVKAQYKPNTDGGAFNK